MKFTLNNSIKFLIILFICQIIFACEKNVTETNIYEDDSFTKTHGRVEIKFLIPDEHLGPGCVKRAELVLAVNADSLYREKYIISFNVSDQQEVYIIFLKPGSYHYQAVVTCMCETNFCSGGGYEGGQYGSKYTADRFYITKDETTFVIPQFR